ncbi:DUF378 domain-containing protein [Sphingomonas sediminicola]|uniref:DUF378 domain-containing protein n=1 Tax=Sphingomonas sediminicola TaxID=386874 RepID=UPI001CA7595F
MWSLLSAGRPTSKRIPHARHQHHHPALADYRRPQLGLVGLFGFDLVATIFGEMSVLSRIVYVLVGVSAIAQIVPLIRAGDQR